MTVRRGHFKDDILDALADHANVAQFVSFDPLRHQRHAWISGHAPYAPFASIEHAVAALLSTSPEHSVNVRSFHPDDPKNREFLYGLTAVTDVVAAVGRLAGQGLHTIVNETVDVNDGGVSGVAFGDLIECAPGDTPRCVEKPGVAAFTRDAGFRLFEIVYGFRPALPDDRRLRVEFSLHPLRRGYRHDHTIIWEIEESDGDPAGVVPTWPNRLSRAIGDKTFGLLVASLHNCRVPRTLAIPRRLAPFQFGMATGSNEPWIRTCPIEQEPGRFTTARGWIDPFGLIAVEDPAGTAIAAVLWQEGVTAHYSGAAITQADGSLLMEGVAGTGTGFMVGAQNPEQLPSTVRIRVQETFSSLSRLFGAVRFEWVDDGREVWIVQLHRGATATTGRIIYPGSATHFYRFDVSDGLDALRVLVDRARDEGAGITLVGRIGVTSHFGDVLRRAKLPSTLETPEA